MSVLHGDTYDALRARAPLAGRARIAEGSYSEIFEGDSSASVYRLSSDNATHDFAARAKRLGIGGVVRLLADYGAVAVYKAHEQFPEYLWLAHLERLAALEDYPAQQAAVSRLLLHLTDSDDGDLLDSAADKQGLLARLADVPVEPSTRDALLALQRLLPQYIGEGDVDIDLNASNFMVRAATGEVLLSDPLSGLATLSDERRARLMAEGIVLDAGY